MRRLTDGDRDVRAEAERDARETEEGLRDEEPWYADLDHDALDCAMDGEAAEIAESWTHVGDDDDLPPW